MTIVRCICRRSSSVRPSCECRSACLTRCATLASFDELPGWESSIGPSALPPVACGLMSVNARVVELVREISGNEIATDDPIALDSLGHAELALAVEEGFGG